jgi:hypothetical protein
MHLLDSVVYIVCRIMLCTIRSGRNKNKRLTNLKLGKRSLAFLFFFICGRGNDFLRNNI